MLHQRIFYNYQICLSPFQPIKSDMADQRAQEQMHMFCSDILNLAYNNPEIIGLKIEPDDCFELYVCNNRKPDLSKSFRKSGELMGNIYRFLCYAALYGEINSNTLKVLLDKQQMKIAKTVLNILPKLGLTVVKEGLSVTLTTDKYPQIFHAMRLLVNVNTHDGEITGKTIFSFAMCIYNGDINYLIRMIEEKNEIENDFFTPYFKNMIDKGYIYDQDCGWCAEGPYFNFKFNNEVSGVHIYFSLHKKHQIYFQLGSQIGVKAICEDFNNQLDHIQNYLLNRLTDCNDCMGCTKGGKNEKFAVEVKKDGTKRLLCPNSFWIGFQIEYMNHDIIKSIIDFSTLQAKYGVNWRKKKNAQKE